jgi:hypothetical protein
MENAAMIPNDFLKPLSILVGTWQTTGTHPLVPGVILHGTVIFEWIEGGAYLKMSSEVDDPRFPTGIAIIGSDNERKEIFMLYFDERNVSRKHDFSITATEWKWWRAHPGFSQRYTVKIENNGDTMVGKGELCTDGSTWKPDLDLTYTRVKETSGQR